MDEISQIFQCSFTLFILKSHEHRFNAVLTAFSKKQGMPTYTFRFFKTKQMRFSSSINDENKASFRRKNWRKYTQKNFKNIAEGYRENRALTELPIMCFWYCTRNA